MATTTETEFDKNVKIIRGSFAQYQGNHTCGLQSLKSDFPKKGILFFDCLPIFENPQLFNLLVELSTKFF